LWTAIEDAAKEKKAPFLVYQESNIIIRAIRDYLRKDISEILIDDENIYRQAHDFIKLVIPHHLSKVKHYDDKVPLFSRYQIESQTNQLLTGKFGCRLAELSSLITPRPWSVSISTRRGRPRVVISRKPR
jgi:Rne/Rng family ribonuclease